MNISNNIPHHPLLNKLTVICSHGITNALYCFVELRIFLSLSHTHTILFSVILITTNRLYGAFSVSPPPSLLIKENNKHVDVCLCIVSFCSNEAFLQTLFLYVCSSWLCVFTHLLECYWGKMKLPDV